MLTVDPANPHRLPAPSPCRSCAISKVGWITALVGALLAVFFFFRQMALQAEVKLEHNRSELAQVEIKALKQQLFAERIVAERQMAGISKQTTKGEAPVVVAYLTPPEKDAISPTAFVMWNPTRQTGVLYSTQVSTLKEDEELRLWVEEENAQPISAGVLAMSQGRASKTEFKAAKPLGLIVRFSVTREIKGATGQPSGPVVMSGAP